MPTFSNSFRSDKTRRAEFFCCRSSTSGWSPVVKKICFQHDREKNIFYFFCDQERLRKTFDAKSFHVERQLKFSTSAAVVAVAVASIVVGGGVDVGEVAVVVVVVVVVAAVGWGGLDVGSRGVVVGDDVDGIATCSYCCCC